MTDVGERIDRLDVGLFAAIESQTSEDDKRSLLAIQGAVRDRLGRYRYLEIGSHLGGSIQPHLLDEACMGIHSIDKRPAMQPDERGVEFAYVDNSTDRMRAAFEQVSPDLDKLVTIDGDTSSLSPDALGGSIDLCFIDGEHTDRAALRDFEFCLDAVGDRGAIVFHDASIVYNGIVDGLDLLRRRGVPFHAYALASVVLVVEVGDLPLHRSATISRCLVDNHVAYLEALRANDHYRVFANRRVFRTLRRLRAGLGRSVGWLTD